MKQKSAKNWLDVEREPGKLSDDIAKRDEGFELERKG